MDITIGDLMHDGIPYTATFTDKKISVSQKRKNHTRMVEFDPKTLAVIRSYEDFIFKEWRFVKGHKTIDLCYHDGPDGVRSHRREIRSGALHLHEPPQDFASHGKAFHDWYAALGQALERLGETHPQIAGTLQERWELRNHKLGLKPVVHHLYCQI